MNSTPVCSRPSENTLCWMASTSGNTRTRPTISACWATRRSLFPSSGRAPRSPALPSAAPCRISMGYRRISCSRTCRRASLNRRSAGLAPRLCARCPPDAKCFASTMMSFSTPPHICSISLGRGGRGSALIGTTTAAWWRARCPAPVEIARMARTERDSIVDVSGLTPDQQFQGGLYCGSVYATPTTPISPTGLCPASQYGSKLLQDTAGRHGEQRSQSAAHRIAQFVRSCHRPRQPVSRRQVQIERALVGGEHGQ